MNSSYFRRPSASVSKCAKRAACSSSWKSAGSSSTRSANNSSLDMYPSLFKSAWTNRALTLLTSAAFSFLSDSSAAFARASMSSFAVSSAARNSFTLSSAINFLSSSASSSPACTPASSFFGFVSGSVSASASASTRGSTAIWASSFAAVSAFMLKDSSASSIAICTSNGCSSRSSSKNLMTRLSPGSAREQSTSTASWRTVLFVSFEMQASSDSQTC
mmetsp:Transcript_112183/g.205475  ORF Transcript_112183/g.205475 Transcript_112183/m.205475 type:complete len:218 (+) Transcript_112183:114-767(+)